MYQKKFKKEEKNDFIFGIRSCIESINSGKEIEKVLIKRGLSGELFGELFQLIRDFEIPFQYVPEQKINRITQKNHQGVIAFVSPIVFQDIQQIIPTLYEEGKVPLVLVLDKVSDVRNFGAISRSAEVAGVHAIVIPDKGSAQINADAMKTSAGALNIIPVCRTSNLKDTVQFLQGCGLKTVASSEKGQSLYYESDLKEPLAIIMGSEGQGVEPALLRIADELIKIPQYGKIDSLNVSVAASILVFEAVRQRNLG